MPLTAEFLAHEKLEKGSHFLLHYVFYLAKNLLNWIEVMGNKVEERCGGPVLGSQ